MKEPIAPYQLPELPSLTEWLRALPDYHAQDQVYFRSRLTRQQFEELLGRPAPSFMAAPPALTTTQQLQLLTACQELGWRRQNREPLEQLRTATSLSRTELEHMPEAIRYIDESVAQKFGLALLEAGYLTRTLLPELGGDYREIRLGYRLDLELRPAKHYRYSEPVGNTFYDSQGKVRSASTPANGSRRR